MAQKVAEQAVEMTIRVCLHCFGNLSIEMKINIYSGTRHSSQGCSLMISMCVRHQTTVSVAFDMLRDIRKSFINIYRRHLLPAGKTVFIDML